MSNDIDNRLQFLQELVISVYDTKELSDCEFSVGKDEVQIKGHTFLMTAFSPVFKVMFYGSLPETGLIRVTDIEPAAFNGMLQFMYLHKVDFTSSKHAVQILLAAKKYMIPSLETSCIDYIKMSLDASTALDVYAFTGSTNVEEVSEICVQRFRNDVTLLNSETFYKADLSTVKLITEQNELNIKSELELFKAIERWATEETARRDITLDELLPELNEVIGNIRFKTMSMEELLSGVEKSPILLKDEKTSLIMNKLQSSLLPYPKRFSICTDMRVKPKPKMEWNLIRNWKNKIELHVCHNHTVPFPKKSVIVSRPILLKGLKVTSDGYVDVHITSTVAGDWTVIRQAAKGKFNFINPVLLTPGETYWIEIKAYSSDFYTNYYDDVCTTYTLHNMTIIMNDYYSQITEMLFKEL